LVIPVGNKGEQKLHLYQREGDKIINKQIEEVSFVPLLSGKS